MVLARVIAFLSAHAQRLDVGDFDAWMAPFEEGATYQIVSAENLRLGMDMPLLLASSKNMIRDRILSLREANIYNIHVDHHVLGLPVIEEEGGAVLKVHTPILVHQIDQDGVATLFCVGRYDDELVDEGESFAIRRREVVFENFGIRRLLATPV